MRLRPPEGAPAKTDAPTLLPARVATRERLGAVLSLLRRPEVAARLPDAARSCPRSIGLCAALAAAGGGEPDLHAAGGGARRARRPVRPLSRQPEQQSLASRTLHNLARLHIEAQRFEQRLTSAAYPFPHVGPTLSVSTFLVRGLPYADGTSGDTLLRNGQLLRRLQDLHTRILGRLATLAEQIEATIDGVP